MRSSQSISVISPTGVGKKVEALLMSMSRPPKASTVRATRRRQLRHLEQVALGAQCGTRPRLVQLAFQGRRILRGAAVVQHQVGAAGVHEACDLGPHAPGGAGDQDGLAGQQGRFPGGVGAVMGADYDGIGASLNAAAAVSGGAPPQRRPGRGDPRARARSRRLAVLRALHGAGAVRTGPGLLQRRCAQARSRRGLRHRAADVRALQPLPGAHLRRGARPHRRADPRARCRHRGHGCRGAHRAGGRRGAAGALRDPGGQCRPGRAPARALGTAAPRAARAGGLARAPAGGSPGRLDPCQRGRRCPAVPALPLPGRRRARARCQHRQRGAVPRDSRRGRPGARACLGRRVPARSPRRCRRATCRSCH